MRKKTIFSIYPLLLMGVFLVFANSCKKDKDDPLPITTEHNYVFDGQLVSAQITSNYFSNVTGSFSINTESNSFYLDIQAGYFKGNISPTNDGYILQITQFGGIISEFDNDSYSGNFDNQTKELILEGNNSGNMTLTGVCSANEQSGHTEQIAQIIVSHRHEGFTAAITIDGITFSPLSYHYADMCNYTIYGYNTTADYFWFQNNTTSNLSCVTITMENINGEMETNTYCNTAIYYLSPNTTYNYSVEWSDGSTSSGSIHTSAAGRTKPLCITKTSGPNLNPGEVYNPATGKIWMDRNLGATQVATSSTDAQSYGDLYQWGRATDGHQLRTSGTTSTPSSSNTPGHGNFILATGYPYDWRNPQNSNLWQGAAGVNNPCPTGFRLPTETEWNAEMQTWGSYDEAGAFASPLKLTMAGGRLGSDGVIYFTGTSGRYWASTVDGDDSRNLSFNNNNASIVPSSRSVGYTVRCIKN